MIYLLLYLAMLVGAVCTLVALTAMRRREKHNVGKFGWLMLILLTPPLGLLLFVFFSGKKVSAEHDQREPVDLPQPPQSDTGDNNDSAAGSSNLAQIAMTRGLPAPSANNRIELHSSPESMHDALFALIAAAEKRLLIHTFILIDDAVGNEIIDLLCQKARQGVEVRLLIDGFGSFVFPDDLLHKVDAAGGRAARFKPLSKLTRFAYSNFRNHRKMAIADGDRAIIGGANFVEYEMTQSPDDETWIDYCLEIEGVTARQVEAVFLSDWKFVTGEHLPPTDKSFKSVLGNESANLQLIPVGPDGATEILDDLWLTAINRARTRIWIITPYFVPPPMATRSLAMAIRRGVEVRIIYPDDSDMPPADFARLDYATDLSELGGQILRLPKKMVHAKMLVIDEEVAYGGSANFDMRSFFLNYELVIAAFDQPTIAEWASWYDRLAQRCIDGPIQNTWTRKSMSVLTRIFAAEL